MNEKQVRQNVVSTARQYLGCKESDGSHKKIIDGYNAHKPLARGYAVKYTDAWCATFVSFVAIMLGYTDIIPTECGCEQQINLFKQKGRWQEDGTVKPEIADVIKKINNVLIATRPSLLTSEIPAAPATKVANTNGTTTIRIKRMNKSPKGFT